MWGQYVKFGNEIRIDATVQDVKHHRTIALKAAAATESDLLGSIERLAASVRENLALSAAAVKELTATSFKPSSTSVQALRYYNEGVELSRQGRYLGSREAVRDRHTGRRGFALAYSNLAQATRRSVAMAKPRSSREWPSPAPTRCRLTRRPLSWLRTPVS